MTYIDGLPEFLDCDGTLSLCVCGSSAFIRCARFMARIRLPHGEIDWLVERLPMKAEVWGSIYDLPRYINLFGSMSDLWVSETNHVVVEILSTECGGMNVSARHSVTGNQLWESFVPIPDAADWAEPAPAWPGAQTEEIHGFIAKDPSHLIVCLFRETRRARIYTRTFEVTTVPPYACQTDAIRLNPSTGQPVWRGEFRDVPIGIIERQSFSGVWSNSPRIGEIDFESGANTILHELPHSLGWPVRDGCCVAVPWHSKSEVGVDWVDKDGARVRKGAWPQPRVAKTYLHRTEAGLGMQTNDQTFWWLGDESLPGWSVRAKPYIYRVHRAPDTNVFLGTDGNGGRLLALDANSGQETLALKPALGGVGHLARLPGHDILASTFRVSRSYSVLSRVLVLSMKDRSYNLDRECYLVLGTWEHGVICRVGKQGERLAVIDIRS
jgi:hypothetical protein